MLTVVGEIARSEVKTYRDRRTGRPAYRLETVLAHRRPEPEDDVLRQAEGASPSGRPGGSASAARACSSARPASSAASGSSPTPRWRCSAIDDDEEVATVEALGDLLPALPPDQGRRALGHPARGHVRAHRARRHPGDAARRAPRGATTSSTPAPPTTGSTRPTTTGRCAAPSGGSASRRRWSPSWCWPDAGARSGRMGAVARSGGDGALLAAFDERLPFELTAGQREVGAQIEHDLAQPHPMNRLLQGEVGSGKTLVALRAMLRTVDSGGQAALLAPTEVLAQQHHRSITALLGDLAAGGMLGGAADGTNVALLTGSMTKTQRKEPLLRHRERRGRHRDRHPRAARGAGDLRRPRPGRGRRAAPLRRRAARRAHRQGRQPAARAGDDRDPDPAHRRDDGVRRPRDRPR